MRVELGNQIIFDMDRQTVALEVNRLKEDEPVLPSNVQLARALSADGVNTILFSMRDQETYDEQGPRAFGLISQGFQKLVRLKEDTRFKPHAWRSLIRHGQVGAGALWLPEDRGYNNPKFLRQASRIKGIANIFTLLEVEGQAIPQKQINPTGIRTARLPDGDMLLIRPQRVLTSSKRPHDHAKLLPRERAIEELSAITEPHYVQPQIALANLRSVIAAGGVLPSPDVPDIRHSHVVHIHHPLWMPVNDPSAAYASWKPGPPDKDGYFPQLELKKMLNSRTLLDSISGFNQLHTTMHHGLTSNFGELNYVVFSYLITNNGKAIPHSFASSYTAENRLNTMHDLEIGKLTSLALPFQ